MIIPTVEADKIREDACKAAAVINTNYYAMARCLVLAKTEFIEIDGNPTPLHLAWGHASAGDWAEAELGIHKGKAHKLILIYTRFGVELAGLWDHSALLSFTKMYDLCRIITPTSNRAHVRQWLRNGSILSCCGLREAIDLRLNGSQPNEYINLRLRVTHEQYLIIHEAILEQVQGAATADPMSKGQAIADICRQSLSRNRSSSRRSTGPANPTNGTPS